MNDLISRQAAIEDIRTMIPKDAQLDIKWIEMWLMQLPSAQPVRHGKWIRDEFGTRCGACGLYAYRDKFDQPWESPYCPMCGAKMDLERKEQ